MQHPFIPLVLCLFASPAFSQDPNANPIGALISPTADIVLFDAPPNGAFQSVPTARAIVQPGIDASTVFALQPDSKAPSGYSVTGQTIAAPSQLVVTGFVDVYQEKSLNRWVQIAPLDSTAPAAWALWGEVGQPPQAFTVTPMGGN
jgi:hypothetical protein